MFGKNHAVSNHGLCQKSLSFLWAIVVGILLTSCATSSSLETPQYTAQEILQKRKQSKRRSGSGRAKLTMQSSGILGTIAKAEVENTIAKEMDGALQCFSKELRTLPYLNGEISLAFRIFEDGSVKTVYPQYSNLGSAGLENCLVALMSKIQFPKPRGGEAEFSHTLFFDLQENERLPKTWNPLHVTQALAQFRQDVYRNCTLNSGRALKITAYILPEGKVFSSGVSSETFLNKKDQSCVLGKLHQTPFPKPGAHPVKITFAI